MTTASNGMLTIDTDGLNKSALDRSSADKQMETKQTA
jgi:hypothetical protein